MIPKTEDGISGFQFCNLTEGNASKVKNKKDFQRLCKASAILGTLQAGYTNFSYVTEATRRITDREALLGVSITGWMDCPWDGIFDEATLREGAELVKSVNKDLAKLLKINPAARTTCVKPSGNSSTLLGTSSGIHPEHSKRYFRNVQYNKDEEIVQLIKEVNPKMVEDSVWSANKTDYCVSFPITVDNSKLFKRDLLGVKQLHYVKLVQEHWVEHGTNIELCTYPNTRHNVSNTITVDNWDEVTKYIYDNRNYFAGISLLSYYGDRAYVQAPFTEVHTAQEILDMYGNGSLFASGLIVDGLHAFNDNLWQACDTLSGYGLSLDDSDSKDLLKRDWVRRAKQFANRYFNGDINKMTECLKDCYNFHKWESIMSEYKDINFSKRLKKKVYVEVDTLGSQACAGGMCEI